MVTQVCNINMHKFICLANKKNPQQQVKPSSLEKNSDLLWVP